MSLPRDFNQACFLIELTQAERGESERESSISGDCDVRHRRIYRSLSAVKDLTSYTISHVDRVASRQQVIAAGEQVEDETSPSKDSLMSRLRFDVDSRD